MALAVDETHRQGFVVFTDGTLATTTTATGATWRQGFLRDADGRLVLSA